MFERTVTSLIVLLTASCCALSIATGSSSPSRGEPTVRGLRQRIQEFYNLAEKGDKSAMAAMFVDPDEQGRYWAKDTLSGGHPKASAIAIRVCNAYGKVGYSHVAWQERYRGEVFQVGQRIFWQWTRGNWHMIDPPYPAEYRNRNPGETREWVEALLRNKSRTCSLSDQDTLRERTVALIRAVAEGDRATVQDMTCGYVYFDGPEDSWSREEYVQSRAESEFEEISGLLARCRELGIPPEKVLESGFFQLELKCVRTLELYNPSPAQLGADVTLAQWEVRASHRPESGKTIHLFLVWIADDGGWKIGSLTLGGIDKNRPLPAGLHGDPQGP